MAEVTELLADAALPVGGGGTVGGLAGYGLGSWWPDPDPDPLERKTNEELRSERKDRWIREGGGIGGFAGIGAVVLEALKVGIG